MKKSFSAFMAIMIACLTVFRFFGTVAFGEGDGEGTTYYYQDFEGFEASGGDSQEFVFNDAKGNKPAGFHEFIGDGDVSGAIISGDKIGGSKSLRLMRYDGGVANIRVTGLNLGAPVEGSGIVFSFKFMYKTLGNYGFTVLLAGIPESTHVEDYGGSVRNVFSACTDDATGKDVFYVKDPAGGYIAAKEGLSPDTDYTVKAVFTAGSDDYSLFINGEHIGDYKYIGKMTNVTAIRFDCHDWAEENDISRGQSGSCHVNEVYFDDIRLSADLKSQSSEQTGKVYKFTGGDYFFLEDFEMVLPGSQYEQPNSDSVAFNFMEELPFLRSAAMPFVNTQAFVMATDQDRDFDGIALAAKDFLDMRFWMITEPDDPDADIMVTFAVKVVELTGCFDLCVTNRNEEGTATDSTDRGGMVLRLEPLQDGKIAVLNTARQIVATFEKGKAVNLGAAFFKDTKNYAVFLDGKMAEGSLSFYPEDFLGVSALRFDLEGSGSEVLMDDIFIEYGELEDKDAKATEKPSQTPAPTETAAANTPAVTDTPSPEPTEAATEVPATADTGNSGETPSASENKGCGGAVLTGLWLPLGALGAAAFMAVRKKKD